MIKRLLLIFSVIIFILGILIFRPISVSSEENCNRVSGTVVGLHEGGPNDIVFRLMDDDKFYYINRGLEAGFTLESLREQLLDQEVTIWAARHWTPLDPKGKVNHICKVAYGEEVLYTEFE